MTMNCNSTGGILSARRLPIIGLENQVRRNLHLILVSVERARKDE